MEFRLITAIIRHDALEEVERVLVERQVRGLTVVPVSGCGEFVEIFGRGGVRHCQVEIWTTDERADEIARDIAAAAHTGTAGDGLVAILPVLSVLRIRTGATATLADLHP